MYYFSAAYALKKYKRDVHAAVFDFYWLFFDAFFDSLSRPVIRAAVLYCYFPCI